MISAVRRLGIAAIYAVFSLTVVAGQTAHATETWEVALRLQLEVERRCQLDHLISVRQLPVEQLGGLEGRVRCKDGREFDFSRSKAHQKFDLRLCAPAVC